MCNRRARTPDPNGFLKRYSFERSYMGVFAQAFDEGPRHLGGR
jgi:hypothetical protein